MGVYFIIWREIRKDVGGAYEAFVVFFLCSGLIGAFLMS